MIRGIYTSALSMAVLEKQQEVTSNNLANANTVGYKKETLVAESFPQMFLHRLNDPVLQGDKLPVGTIGTGIRIAGVMTDFSRGIVRKTDEAQQLALSGEGYFVVNTPAGERYTRNGEFKIASDGTLVTSDGYGVQGQQGAIAIGEKSFSINDNGIVFINGQEADRLRVVTFAQQPIKEGSTLFKGTAPQEVDTPRLVSGFVEESNAAPLEEMVNMINIMRAYEANQKVIQAQDSTLEKAVNDVGRI